MGSVRIEKTNFMRNGVCERGVVLAKVEFSWQCDLYIPFSYPLT